MSAIIQTTESDSVMKQALPDKAIEQFIPPAATAYEVAGGEISKVIKEKLIEAGWKWGDCPSEQVVYDDRHRNLMLEIGKAVAEIYPYTEELDDLRRVKESALICANMIGTVANIAKKIADDIGLEEGLERKKYEEVFEYYLERHSNYQCFFTSDEDDMIELGRFAVLHPTSFV